MIRRKSTSRALFRKHDEDLLQAQCVNWFRVQYPDKEIFHIPNGGKRNLLEAIRLKRMGVRRGVSDLFIAEPTNIHNGLFVELKTETGKITDDQKTFLNKMKSRGYEVGVVRTFEEFQRLIICYFIHRIGPDKTCTYH